MVSAFLTFCLSLFLATASGPSATPSMVPSMVIVQPGYPGSTRDAEGFMARLTGYLGGKTGLAGLQGAYYNDAKKALSAIAEKKPGFGIVSVGFYLENRRKLGLKPLARVKPGDNFVVVARAGELKDAAALSGKTVTGGPIQEKKYLERVVFHGKADVTSWDAKPSRSPASALRGLLKKKRYAAVVLTGREYRGFQAVYPAKVMEKVLESDYYPPALLVAFHAAAKSGPAGSGPDRGDGKEVRCGAGSVRPLPGDVLGRVAGAFLKISSDPEGKAILETMGTEGFEKIPSGWLEKVERRYDGSLPEEK